MSCPQHMDIERGVSSTSASEHTLRKSISGATAEKHCTRTETAPKPRHPTTVRLLHARARRDRPSCGLSHDGPPRRRNAPSIPGGKKIVSPRPRPAVTSWRCVCVQWTQGGRASEAPRHQPEWPQTAGAELTRPGRGAERPRAAQVRGGGQRTWHPRPPRVVDGRGTTALPVWRVRCRRARVGRLVNGTLCTAWAMLLAARGSDSVEGQLARCSGIAPTTGSATRLRGPRKLIAVDRGGKRKQI